MDGLLRCERCRHGAPAHDGSGCEVADCSCRATREEVIAFGIEAAKDELRRAWDRPPTGTVGEPV